MAERTRVFCFGDQSGIHLLEIRGLSSANTRKPLNSCRREVKSVGTDHLQLNKVIIEIKCYLYIHIYSFFSNHWFITDCTAPSF